MKTFSLLALEYDCPDCAALTAFKIDMPAYGESRQTRFECKECGRKSVLTVGLEPEERKGEKS